MSREGLLSIRRQSSPAHPRPQRTGPERPSVDVIEARHPHPECGYHDDAQFGIVGAMVYCSPIGNAWARSGGRNAQFTGRVS